MPVTFASVILCLFVINHGIAFGAGLYEMRMVTPAWIDAVLAGRDEKFPDAGRRFWGMVTTAPLTLLTLAGLFLAWKTPGAQGAWWRAAVLVTLAERVLTFSYFIPTMVRLQGGKVAPAKAPAVAARWANVNYLRMALSLAAWLAALRAFSLPG
jgi:hypothetical protein